MISRGWLIIEKVCKLLSSATEVMVITLLAITQLSDIHWHLEQSIVDGKSI